MRIEMPRSLRLDHDELAQTLAGWSHEPGRLGEEIRRVARLLEPHMREVRAEMAQVFPHTDWLKNHAGTLVAEHRMILAAAEQMLEAARGEQRLDCLEFAERLINHLRVEEEVLYPAAILVGEYLRLALASHERAPIDL